MAIVVKEEATTAWCSHCSINSQTQWERDFLCCLGCGKILGQIFLGKLIREGKLRRISSGTDGRRQRRRRASAVTDEEPQILNTLIETDSS